VSPLAVRGRHAGFRFDIIGARELRRHSRGVFIEERLRSVLHVAQGHRRRRVAQELLHPDDRHARLRRMDGEGVPRIVRPRTGDAGCRAGRVPHVPEDAISLEVACEDNVIGSRPDTREVLRECAFQGLGDRQVAHSLLGLNAPIRLMDRDPSCR